MISAVLPAAGRSERMGRPKLSLPWGGGTVLGSLLESFLAAGAGPLVVVVRREDVETASAAEELGALVEVNPDPERGMLSSVRAGLQRLERELPTWPLSVFVCPADLPAVRPETIRGLAELELAPDELVLPTFRGESGHPLRLGEGLVPEVFSLDPSIGLRQIRERRPGGVRTLPVDDPGVLRDVDTPADYESLRKLIS